MKFPTILSLVLVANNLVTLSVLAGEKKGPARPVVVDEGAFTTSSTKLYARWTSAPSAAPIAKYRYQIREGSTSGAIVSGWTAIGLASEMSFSGLNLYNGTTYFIGVKAIDKQGRESQPGYSDGILAQNNNLRPPAPPPPPSSVPPPPAPVTGEYQGFGANAQGGKGQPVYRVTNLNDSGPGSFRDAVSQGNRYVVFDVAGDISLNSSVPIRGAFITIDGFTAPAPGITLQNYGVGVDGRRGNHDIIIRGIRVRRAGNTLDGATPTACTWSMAPITW